MAFRVSQLAVSAIYNQIVTTRVSQLAVSVIYTPIRGTGVVAYSPQYYQPTLSRQFGFSVNVYDNNDVWIERLDIVDGWNHTISANGGFTSASLEIQLSQRHIEEWIEKGIGRRIILSVDSVPIWEGFVNSLSAKIGPLTFTRGPLMDIGNRVLATYTPIDTTVDPPVSGDTTETLFAEDLSSQEKWGIIEKIIDAGECTDDDADMYRDTYLQENLAPLSSKDISMGGGDTGLTLELLGFSAWLTAYTYYSTSILFCTATQKIKNVLASDPNGIFNPDYSLVQDNAYLVQAGEPDRNTSAESVIKGVVDLGDVNEDRWIFGMDVGRKVYYKPTLNSPSDIVYFQRFADPAQRIYDIAGNIVYPWEVKPGNWLFILDFMAGKDKTSNLNDDARAIFIEEVSFSIPWDVSFRSGAIKKLDQIIAKKSMSRGQ